MSLERPSHVAYAASMPEDVWLGTGRDRLAPQGLVYSVVGTPQSTGPMQPFDGLGCRCPRGRW
jgi:hypothetical protein